MIKGLEFILTFCATPVIHNWHGVNYCMPCESLSKAGHNPVFSSFLVRPLHFVKGNSGTVPRFHWIDNTENILNSSHNFILVSINGKKDCHGQFSI